MIAQKPFHDLMSIHRQLSAMLAVAIALLFAPLAYADELVSLKTRPGVTQTILLWEPHQSNPETVILLIPGGPGNIGLGLKDGRVEAQAPYLFSDQRKALMQDGFAVAVIDAPSDQTNMSQEYRASSNHAVDLKAVMREILRRFPKARLVLMAHSRGTVSAGYILQNMPDQVSAAVLFSGLHQASPPNTPTALAGPGLSKINWASQKVPVLLVHHIKDACWVAPFAAAAATHIPMIAVNGAANKDDESPCGPDTNHWFTGIESAVGQEAINWLSGKPWKSSLP
ncbi:alpha/beta fold hydrolase [Undibacterium sp.]|uniref:alpha/beta hydrolase n=1 Tax=Undibacterium sp. TaxID=1914977 RepID=UPI0025F03373|nr:alpha/beta fold hydrolase [Undibacterium sp.]